MFVDKMKAALAVEVLNVDEFEQYEPTTLTKIKSWLIQSRAIIESRDSKLWEIFPLLLSNF